MLTHYPYLLFSFQRNIFTSHIYLSILYFNSLTSFLIDLSIIEGVFHQFINYIIEINMIQVSYCPKQYLSFDAKHDMLAQ